MRTVWMWYSLRVPRSQRSIIDLYHAYFVHGAVALMVLCVAMGGLLIYMLSGLDEVPRWWYERDAMNVADAAVIERAERIENAITTQLTAVRDPQDPRWNAKVSDEQANAWIGVRLRETIITHMGEDAWDGRVERMLMRFDEDGITIGARVRHNSGASIVSARARLMIDEQGDLYARIGSIRIGTTPIPSWVVSLLGQGDVRPGRMRLGPGALELGDGRVARLVAIRTRDQWVDVAVETVSQSQ